MSLSDDGDQGRLRNARVLVYNVLLLMCGTVSVFFFFFWEGLASEILVTHHVVLCGNEEYFSFKSIMEREIEKERESKSILGRGIRLAVLLSWSDQFHAETQLRSANAPKLSKV